MQASHYCLNPARRCMRLLGSWWMISLQNVCQHGMCLFQSQRKDSAIYFKHFKTIFIVVYWHQVSLSLSLSCTLSRTGSWRSVHLRRQEWTLAPNLSANFWVWDQEGWAGTNHPLDQLYLGRCGSRKETSLHHRAGHANLALFPTNGSCCSPSTKPCSRSSKLTEVAWQYG